MVVSTHACSYQNQTNSSSFHQTIGHCSSNPFVLLTRLQQTVCGLSCVLSLEEAASWGDSHVPQFDVECGVWSEHFNLCSNADSTPTPIFQRKHLDMTLSTCAQLLWTTYLSPVLSWPRSFKTLDDLSHCAAAQFQGVGNLLVALAIFM